jgi:hypothetical protein
MEQRNEHRMVLTGNTSIMEQISTRASSVVIEFKLKLCIVSL